eukprot:TRINITY_DN63125_c0_g1_i1.p1 TRINITY_DN63125_c0_g1~~TRINITY_DN63125_c0_g1_i1.p1  ORF type:complete len:165 (+),score=22.40 TRINITY_DN63125_c0_g1_i1:137-631(+)
MLPTSPAKAVTMPTPDLSLDSTSLHTLITNGGPKQMSTSPDPIVEPHPQHHQSNTNLPARQLHSDWESIWANPVRGTDFMRGLPCVRDVYQYDPYGLSFLRSYDSESERALRLATTPIDQITQEDSRDALLSMFRDCSGTSYRLTASSPYSLPPPPQRLPLIHI